MCNTNKLECSDSVKCYLAALPFCDRYTIIIGMFNRLERQEQHVFI